MVVIQVHVRRNNIDNVLLDGGLGSNIITEQWIIRLGLLKPKPTPYNLQVENYTIIKPVKLIRDLKMYVHVIPYVATFTFL
jgi:hypothetical protein